MWSYTNAGDGQVVDFYMQSHFETAALWILQKLHRQREEGSLPDQHVDSAFNFLESYNDKEE